MFKKFIGILLVLVLALSLAACGGKGEKPAGDSAPASSDAGSVFCSPNPGYMVSNPAEINRLRASGQASRSGTDAPAASARTEKALRN